VIPDDWKNVWANFEVFDGGHMVRVGGAFWYHVKPYRTDGSAHGPASSGTILSPMPGRIIAVEVTAGQSVTKGQKLLTLEAMKMEHSLTAPFEGTIAELNAETGGQVQEGMLLVRVEAVEA
jgi:3-methylcrotonyl-CoA carboxylase alpha subunit